MSGIATAIVGGAVISGVVASNAASTQANAATQSAQTAADAQMNALKFVQQQEQPYQQAGQKALGQYQNLLNGGAANFDVSKMPGYAFEQQQGQQAIQNSAAARGQALSGNTMQGLQQYGQGLASTQFQSYMSQLAGLANMGQASASGVANQGASLMSGAGASLAGGQMAAGNAQAAGMVGMGNAFNQGLTGLTGFYGGGGQIPLGGSALGAGQPYVDPATNPQAYGYSGAAGGLPYGG